MLAENFRIWRNKVYAEGRLEGKLEGKLEGRLEGRLEGEKDAYQKANRKTAYKLLAMGMSPESVANILEISIVELKALVEQD